MTRDEVLKLARESGLSFHLGQPREKAIAQLERFAELVAAAEQERILRIVYEQSVAYGNAGECMWIGVKSKVRYVPKTDWSAA